MLSQLLTQQRAIAQQTQVQTMSLLGSRIISSSASSSSSVATRRLRLLLLRAAPTQITHKRTLISAPKPGDGPLMERRPDRELPNIERSSRLTRALPLFALLIVVASVAIFNYQKQTSPIVSATLYALRVSEKGREALGENIYFAQQIPWISGEMNQVKGRINISFRVKGTRAEGVMHFASFRPTPRGVFETTEWWIEVPSSSSSSDAGKEGKGKPKTKKIDLLEDGDPFRGMTSATDSSLLMVDDDEEVKRGYRK